MNKKILVLIIFLVLAALGAGVWYVWKGSDLGEIPLYEGQEPAKLFSKDDYRIEEKNGAKYVVVDKVGLLAKVPEGWSVELQGDDYPESEYWVSMYSFEKKIQHGLLIEGCNINLIASTEKQNNKSTKIEISLIKDNPKNAKNLKEDYVFEIVIVSKKEGLGWLSPEKEMVGQTIGIDLPISNDKLLTLNSIFLPNYKQQCEPIWNEFINNIEIK